jgi:hypothetical protein
MATAGEPRALAEVERKGIFKAHPRFPGSTLPKKNVKDSDFTKAADSGTISGKERKKRGIMGTVEHAVTGK